MNYAFRLGLVHFMRRDPNGIRRDPRWGVHGIVLLAWVLCIFVRDPTGSAVTRCRGSTQEDAQRASGWFKNKLPRASTGVLGGKHVLENSYLQLETTWPASFQFQVRILSQDPQGK